MQHKIALLMMIIAAQMAVPAQAGDLSPIKHIIVIYLENHSFDSLYGKFPGANGIVDASPEVSMQSDIAGRLYESLPPVMNAEGKNGMALDRRFPTDLINEPFDIGEFVAPDKKINDLPHRFYLHQQQINGGRMNLYAALSEAGALTMGHYDTRKLPLSAYASQYTLADNFFQAAFGGSFLNHQWLVCACTPHFENAPDDLKTEMDEADKVHTERALTPDGFAVNTIQPLAFPFNPKYSDASKRLPAQTQPTIGDRLSEKGISWAWYAGGWNDAIAGHAATTFRFHHQPFVYYKNYAEGSKARAEHLKDGAEFLSGIQQGQLPQVVFYKPIGALNEHPGYADLLSGEQHVADIVDKIQHSPLWQDSLILITYDEYGGFWDHVAPPTGDRWGPGTRVPALIISPYAKRNHVDHTVYDTTSILKLIETRFGLEPLGSRDAQAGDLSNALDFGAAGNAK